MKEDQKSLQLEYIKAQLTRPILKSAFLKSMKGLDGLAVPTLPILPAPLLNEEVVDINGQSLEVYQVLSRLTTAFDVTDLPALNVPAGLVDGKLPVGVHLVGRPFDEGSILSMAHIFEKYHGISQTLVPTLIRV